MTVEGNGEVSKASDIRAANRKIVELPTGFKVQIRKLTGMDFLAMGKLPAVAVAKKNGGKADDVRKHYTDNPEALVAQHRMILCSAVVSPILRDAHPSECDESKNELSVWEITDLNFLVTEILKFSGLTEEAALKAAPFPEGTGVASSGRDGGSVSSASE